MSKISKYFTRKEIECKCGCGFDSMDVETLQVADAAREWLGAPIICNSGCRCSEHNAKIGGATKSQHVRARAMDLATSDPEALYDWLCKEYEGKYGFGKYNSFVHIDTRTNGPARWDGTK